MILFILMMAAWSIMVVSFMSRRSHRLTPPVPDSGSQSRAEAWSRLDELQLTRLLRNAAQAD